jgi:spermidine/putrescine transport system ATP-binding protein
MQIELQNLQRSVGITFILVTHDQEEALSMSDRVCLMREGRIVQVGSPRSLYDQPSSRYVADFVGKSNFFDGIARAVGADGIAVDLDAGMATVARPSPTAPAIAAGDRVAVSVRPEQMIVSRAESALPEDGAFRTTARVLNRIFLGEHTEYLLRCPSLGDFLVLTPRRSELNERPFETGEAVHVAWSRDAALTLGGT